MSKNLIYECRLGQPSRIESVQLGLMSPDEIRRMSVVHTTESIIYEKQMPKMGGPNDQRMGVIDRFYKCKTCGNTSEVCNGHPGHIELAFPVYHVGYIEMVMKILKLVCHFCSRLLIQEGVLANLEKNILPKYGSGGVNQFEAVSKLLRTSKIIKCPHCESPQPTYKKQKNTPLQIQTIWSPKAEFKTELEEQFSKKPFTSLDALEILEAIPDEDCRLLGFNPKISHPSWMILTVLVVCPPVIRPSVAESSGSKTRGQDDLTRKIKEIITANKNILYAKEESSKLVKSSIPLLKDDEEDDEEEEEERENQKSGGDDDQKKRQQSDGIKENKKRKKKIITPSKKKTTRTNLQDKSLFSAHIIPELYDVTTSTINDDEWKPSDKLINELQYHVATLMNNEVKGQKQSTQRSGTPSKGVKQRLKGKDGRVRNDLSAKRVDFSSRAVISPAPDLDIGKIGVPEYVACTLTYKERVNSLNLEKMREKVRRGPGKLHGAETVITPTGELICLDPKNSKINESIASSLTIGSLVERYMENGDWVVFNRQPSLHKVSMMGHQVQIVKQNTFTLPLPNTPSYNADFDGDEMNLHFPQSEGARAEVAHIMNVGNQILSHQSNRPIIGLVQDSIVGSLLMTRANVFLTREKVMDLIMCLQYTAPGRKSNYELPVPVILKPKPLWSGKQVYSMLLPKNLNMERKVRSLSSSSSLSTLADDLEERWILIQQGEIICGALCKQMTGIVHGGLIHAIAKDHSQQEAYNFISDAQRMVNLWLTGHNLSVGMDDCRSSKKCKQKVDQLLQKTEEKITSIYNTLSGISVSGQSSSQLEQQQQQQEMNNHPKKSGVVVNSVIEKEVEKTITSLANNLRGQVSNLVLEDATFDNSIYTIITSGSKGSLLNPTQMYGLVGQQVVDGKRVHTDTSTRSLPCFSKRDPQLKSRGFVANSYERGLNEEEYYFHMMGGREGLVDTAVKTSWTGYIQRKFVNAMNSLVVQFNGSVVNSQGKIVQFVYGTDRMDASFIEKVPLRLLNMDNTQIRIHIGESASDDEYQTLITLRNRIHQSKMFGYFTGEWDSFVLVTVHVERLLSTYVTPPSITPSSAQTQEEIYREIVYLCKKIDEISFRGDSGRRENSSSSSIRFFYSDRIQALVRTEFCSRIAMAKFGGNVNEVKQFCQKILHFYEKHMINSGEVVGSLAAESMGEPTTQMTLKTFHTAGIMEKNVTLGIPRLRELIDLTKNIKNPSAFIYLQPPYNKSKEQADVIRRALEHIPFSKTVESYIVTSHQHPSSQRDLHCSIFWSNQEFIPFSLIFTLNKVYMQQKNLTPHIIEKALISFFNESEDVVIFASETTTIKWTIEICLLKSDQLMQIIDDEETSKKKSTTDDIDQSSSSIETTTTTLSPEELQRIKERIFMFKLGQHLQRKVQISGLVGIHRAFLSEVSRTQVCYQTGKQTIEKEWIIETEGTCLERILSLSFVNPYRTYSNDIHEMVKVFGIEAGVSLLFHELKAIISFDGTYVNDRHIMLAVDSMTYLGTLLAMNRHGLNKIDSGFLVKSCFEETVEVFFNAAAFGEENKLTGVMENIIYGQTAPIGTGQCHDYIKKDYIKRWLPNEYARIYNPSYEPQSKICLSELHILQSYAGTAPGISAKSSTNENQSSDLIEDFIQFYSLSLSLKLPKKEIFFPPSFDDLSSSTNSITTIATTSKDSIQSIRKEEKRKLSSPSLISSNAQLSKKTKPSIPISSLLTTQPSSSKIISEESSSKPQSFTSPRLFISPASTIVTSSLSSKNHSSRKYKPSSPITTTIDGGSFMVGDISSFFLSREKHIEISPSTTHSTLSIQ